MAGQAVIALAEALGSARLASIPDALADRAADCILDVLGAALAGRAMQSSRAMAATMLAAAAAGHSSVWFGGRRVAAAPAATVNAMCATALDVDDGHRRAAGHPGAAVIAGAIASAEHAGATLADLITATVIGYEAAIRVALARNPAHHTSTVSGRWSGVGAAAAAAWLYRCSREQITQAILIAEQHAPRAGSAMHHGFAGSDVKEAIAWSVHTGLYAVELARNGFQGYPDTFDQNILYDPVILCRDLGRFDAIGGLFFKPYACCRWIHSAIDALHGVMRENDLAPKAVTAVSVHTFERAVGLGNHVAPQTETEAQFSIPFCLGITAVHGTSALLPLDAGLLGDAEVRAFAQKVSVQRDDSIDAKFPVKAPARVVVETARGTFSAYVDAAFGDPTNPMSRADLQRKFARLADGRIAAERAERVQASLAQWRTNAQLAVRDWSANLV